MCTRTREQNQRHAIEVAEREGALPPTTPLCRNEMEWLDNQGLKLAIPDRLRAYHHREIDPSCLEALCQDILGAFAKSEPQTWKVLLKRLREGPEDHRAHGG
jgi:hypothetical protein